jgi:hypothetical protein
MGQEGREMMKEATYETMGIEWDLTAYSSPW